MRRLNLLHRVEAVDNFISIAKRLLILGDLPGRGRLLQTIAYSRSMHHCVDSLKA